MIIYKLRVDLINISLSELFGILNIITDLPVTTLMFPLSPFAKK